LALLGIELGIHPCIERSDFPGRGHAIAFLLCVPIDRLILSDGLAGEIDLRDELTGPVFEPLKDPDMFRRFRLDPELHTLVWPNGADFAPEFLRARLGGEAA